MFKFLKKVVSFLFQSIQSVLCLSQMGIFSCRVISLFQGNISMRKLSINVCSGSVFKTYKQKTELLNTSCWL